MYMQMYEIQKSATPQTGSTDGAEGVRLHSSARIGCFTTGRLRNPGPGHLDTCLDLSRTHRLPTIPRFGQ